MSVSYVVVWPFAIAALCVSAAWAVVRDATRKQVSVLGGHLLPAPLCPVGSLLVELDDLNWSASLGKARMCF